jgi:hypothetical protein
VKRGTLAHPKMRDLARLLSCEPWMALGLLNALLEWAYAYAPQGDVGRYTDAEIADGWVEG